MARFHQYRVSSNGNPTHKAIYNWLEQGWEQSWEYVWDKSISEGTTTSSAGTHQLVDENKDEGWITWLLNQGLFTGAVTAGVWGKGVLETAFDTQHFLLDEIGEVDNTWMGQAVWSIKEYLPSWASTPTGKAIFNLAGFTGSLGLGVEKHCLMLLIAHLAEEKSAGMM